MRSTREFHLEDQIIQFVTCFNEKFSVVKTQIFLMDPLPNINRIYSMFIQEKSKNVPCSLSLLILFHLKRVLLLLMHQIPKIPKIRVGFITSNYPKKDGRLCTYCYKTSHTIDVCYRKHGFPPSFGKKQVSANATNADNGESHN